MSAKSTAICTTDQSIINIGGNACNGQWTMESKKPQDKLVQYAHWYQTGNSDSELCSVQHDQETYKVSDGKPNKLHGSWVMYISKATTIVVMNYGDKWIESLASDATVQDKLAQEYGTNIKLWLEALSTNQQNALTISVVYGQSITANKLGSYLDPNHVGLAINEIMFFSNV